MFRLEIKEKSIPSVASLMFGPPNTPEELHSYHPDITQVFDKAYKRVAMYRSENPRNMYFRSYCQDISRESQNEFANLGYLALRQGRSLESGSWHEYPTLISDEDMIIADGTWQQFLPVLTRPRRSATLKSKLPKVLVGTPETVVGIASEAGVPDKYLGFWTREAPEGLQKQWCEKFEGTKLSSLTLANISTGVTVNGDNRA